jgi:beta-galactosidase
MTLTTSSSEFLLHGQPFRILSGALHYFRVLPACWRDRLEKMRAFGLNTVETYVAWNLHEPRPGEFHFEGQLDLVKFIETAAEVGLKVLVRPGPYICSEWEFGGLPAWLLKDPAMQIRCAYPPYLAAVDRFFDALLPRLAPLQSTRGGPVIGVQVENEYGSYGNDKVYLRHLADGLRARGIDSFLFTSDGPRDSCLQGGTLPEVFKTVNLAFNPAEAFAKLREYQPEGPLMVMEFWAGWFDHWGESHHLSADGSDSIQSSVAALDELLALGASVNFYMFHGGTNFGFMSGANQELTGYHSAVTSYDYASPLDEAGDPSPRFAAYREVLQKYVELPPAEIPPLSRKAGYGVVALTESVGLFDALESLSQPVASVTPPSMEMLDQAYGFILYRTRFSGPHPEALLQARQVHDRAQLFLDGRFQATLERETGDEYASFEVPAGGLRADLLVENLGRINFGPAMLDRKGILDGVTYADQLQFGWETYPLPLDDLSGLHFSLLSAAEGPVLSGAEGPAFFRASFDVSDPADSFLALPGWTKGVVWVNGFNLGRYWDRGPQRTLFIPAPLLKQGKNELIVFELHAAEQLSVEFRAAPDLGQP